MVHHTNVFVEYCVEFEPRCFFKPFLQLTKQNYQHKINFKTKLKCPTFIVIQFVRELPVYNSLQTDVLLIYFFIWYIKKIIEKNYNNYLKSLINMFCLLFSLLNHIVTIIRFEIFWCLLVYCCSRGSHPYK